ncbi:MAG: TlyA family RNA methyltransferase [Rhodospirillales bacterium]|nr:TlyA family RNA methyltransferase [Rhodospirillales bacterium]
MAGKPAKKRLDQLLVERGLVESLAIAQGLIMAGKVYSLEQRLDKAGQQISENTALEVRGQDHPWVSRGGLKLAHGLAEFSLSVDGCTAVDIGASTGGFTDVLVQSGAARVYAVDVGQGQLAWKLRTDARVIVLEKTNARHLSAETITDAPDIIVCDASFIGLQTVLPAAMALAGPGAHLVALIKPQFEVARHQVSEGGVVRDPALHEQVCETTKRWINETPGWTVIGLTTSPIKGPEGNVEFLIAARKVGTQG